MVEDRIPTPMKRLTFIATGLAAGLPASLLAQAKRPMRILLRSSWQTVNIGDIAHTPGMLALLEKKLGMEDWVFEIDASTGKRIAERVVAIGRDLPAARIAAAEARERARERMAAMIHALA